MSVSVVRETRRGRLDRCHGTGGGAQGDGGTVGVQGDQRLSAAAIPDPLAAVPDAVCHLDRSCRLTYLNAAAATMARRTPAELLGRPLFDFFPAARGSVIEQGFREALADGRARTFEFHDEPRDRWYEVRAFPDDDGMAVVLRDEPRAGAAPGPEDAERARLARVLEAVPAAGAVVDGTGRILAANAVWRRERDGVGEDYLRLVGPRLDPADHAVVAAGIRGLLSGDDDQPTFDHTCRPSDGGAARLRIRAARVDDPPRVVVTHTEVPGRDAMSPRRGWQHHHDDLTDLPNRAAMLELIGAALAEAGEGGPGTAVLFLDLDGFKTVNDSLGHEVGDALLCEAAGRLVEQVRPGDAVGRLGGDQFLVLARGCDSAEAAALAFR
ncbi:MAG: diguanylate cyclase/phosphodiesterase with sensor(s), partial [Frankiales bacterium]|nr:diguanylate cyclase/phosphodiesterase with sensor(s) [Frankiales bacterium]